MKHVLAATDLSPRGGLAVTRGLAIAAEHGAALTVVHVIDADLPQSVRDLVAREAHGVCADQIAAAEAEVTPPDPVAVAIEVPTGRPHDVLAERAEALDADIVVVGSHRREPRRDLFVGTTVERLLRSTERPVLMARTPGAAFPLRALAAVDFSVGSRRALEAAARLLPSGSIDVVHVFDLPMSSWVSGEVGRSYEAQVRAMIDEEVAALLDRVHMPGIAVERVLHQGPVVDTILAEAKRRLADLLVIGTHGRVGVGHAVFGSVARELIDRAECDVLAVRGW